MTAAADVHRLDGLRIGEVSGVDHPAHLTPGWLMLKSATGLSDDEMAEIVAEAKALAKSAEAPTAAQSPSPSQEVVMSDSTDQTTGLSEDIFKSLPEPVRKALEESRLVAETALTELRKERDQRSDLEAIAKAKADYGNIPGLDPAEFGPIVRKAAEADPEGVAEILKALATANAALAESALLKEVGSSVTPAAGGNAYAQVQSLAKAALDKGEVETIEQGVAKALTDNPALYTDYINEKGA